MKTAEEWLETVNWCSETESLAAIKQIQLDAWKQGMSDAVAVINNTESPWSDESNRIQENIEQTRDSKQSL